MCLCVCITYKLYIIYINIYIHRKSPPTPLDPRVFERCEEEESFDKRWTKAAMNDELYHQVHATSIECVL